MRSFRGPNGSCALRSSADLQSAPCRAAWLGGAGCARPPELPEFLRNSAPYRGTCGSCPRCKASGEPKGPSGGGTAWGAFRCPPCPPPRHPRPQGAFSSRRPVRGQEGDSELKVHQGRRRAGRRCPRQGPTRGRRPGPFSGFARVLGHPARTWPQAFKGLSHGPCQRQNGSCALRRRPLASPAHCRVSQKRPVRKPSRRDLRLPEGAAALRAVEDPIKGRGCLDFRASPGGRNPPNSFGILPPSYWGKLEQGRRIAGHCRGKIGVSGMDLGHSPFRSPGYGQIRSF